MHNRIFYVLLDTLGRPWQGRYSKGNPPHASHPRRRSAGDLYGKRRRGHLQKVLTDGRSGRFCRADLRFHWKKHRAYRSDFRPRRSDRSCRRAYQFKPGDTPLRVCDGVERYFLGVAVPILSEGDLMGCVCLLLEDGADALGPTELQLAQTVAGFLGRQMES